MKQNETTKLEAKIESLEKEMKYLIDDVSELREVIEGLNDKISSLSQSLSKDSE